MSRTLITPAEVISKAFSADEILSPDAVLEEDILSAEEGRLVPVIGRPLYDALRKGLHTELVGEYIAPALALHTRLLIQGRLNVRTTSVGTTAPHDKPTETALHALRASLRRQASLLMRRLTVHLNRNTERYPEYNPAYNPLNRCSTDGNLIQIL